MGLLGPRIKQILNASNVQAMPIVSAAVVYTQSFSLKSGEYFGLAYLAKSSGGSPQLKIELEQSVQKPTTEGVADSMYAVPVGMSDIESAMTAETMQIRSLQPVTMPYGRFKITGGGANPADTTLTIWIAKQEQI